MNFWGKMKPVAAKPPKVDLYNSASNPGGKGPWSFAHPYRNAVDKLENLTPVHQGPAHPSYFEQKGQRK